MNEETIEKTKYLEEQVARMSENVEQLIIVNKKENAFLLEIQNQLNFIAESENMDYEKRRNLFSKLLDRFAEKYEFKRRGLIHLLFRIMKDYAISTWKTLLVFYTCIGLFIYHALGVDKFTSWIIQLPFIYIGTILIVSGVTFFWCIHRGNKRLK